MYKNMKFSKLQLFFAAFALLPFLSAAQNADTRGVERALLDYVEGFYEGDTAKLIRGIHPEVKKYGYWKEKGSEQYTGEAMSFAEMLEYANRVRTKKRFPKPDAPKKVEVYEVLDQTATGKVTAWWGTDYILLAKYDGQWKIVYVLWQSPPAP